MPVLRDASGVIEDSWIRVDHAGEIADGMKVILPWREEFVAPAGLPRFMLGLHLPNDVSAESVAPQFARLGLVSVDFPSFADGRGFSLGRRVRNLGFRGRLRAFGPVIADQFAYLLACGFDEVETPESLDRRQPQPQWERALRAISCGYQPGYGSGRSVMQMRHQFGMEP